MSIKYQAGYKYQLISTAVCMAKFAPPELINTEFIEFRPDGMLIVRDGYAWDGPSGPTIDTKNFMRGSLFHDALYQLMREGLLDHGAYRERADALLRDICLEDDMSAIRAHWVYLGVRMFGDASAHENKDILVAP